MATTLVSVHFRWTFFEEKQSVFCFPQKILIENASLMAMKKLVGSFFCSLKKLVDINQTDIDALI